MKTFLDDLREAKYRDDNLPSALESRNEITVDYGEYILVSLGIDHRSGTEATVVRTVKKPIGTL